MNGQNNLQSKGSVQSSKNIWIIIVAILVTALIVSVGVYAWQRSVLKATEHSLQQQILSLQKQVEILKEGQLTLDNSSNQVGETTIPDPDIKYRVVLKEDSQDSSKTDVYIKSLDNGNERFLMTLTDVNSRHYHNSEYYNGNLYILKRIGYDGYPDETWSDELWRYDAQKVGTRLYSDKGIDFRVNGYEGLIVIVTNEEFNILSNNGKKIKSFKSAEVMVSPKEIPMFGFLAWGSNSIWLDNTFGPSLAGLVKIDTKTYSVTKYDLKDLPAGPEFAINVSTEKLAFSNYPALFDVYGAEKYKESGAKVNLIVYDLNSGVQQQVASSITKRFEPKWINSNTLEYNDPNSNIRIQKIIK